MQFDTTINSHIVQFATLRTLLMGVGEGAELFSLPCLGRPLALAARAVAPVSGNAKSESHDLLFHLGEWGLGSVRGCHRLAPSG